MAEAVQIELEVPTELDGLRLPGGVQARLQSLLDRQDSGDELTASERAEAEGLVDVAELLSLLRARANRLSR